MTHLRDVVLDAYLRDTVNARALLTDGSYEPVRPKKDEKPFDAQAWFTTLYRKGSPTGETAST